MPSFPAIRRWAALGVAAVAVQGLLAAANGIDLAGRGLAAETTRRALPATARAPTMLLAVALLLWALWLWQRNRPAASPVIAGLLTLPVLGIAIGFGPVPAALAIGLVLLAGRLLRRPAAGDLHAPGHELEAARAIIDEHGEDSLSPFILRPDKAFDFAAGGVLAYRVVAETVVVSGDPVAPDGSAPDVLAQFVRAAHARGCRVALYGASAVHLARYRTMGLRAICVGEEAVVLPARFTLEGRAVRKLRQSVNRIERRGWEVTAREGREIDAGLESEIGAVEDAWRTGRRRLLGFAMGMGEFERGVRARDLYVLGRSPEGDLRAVMRFISHRGKLSLDTMRRVGETPNGLNEALVCRALQIAREQGIAEVSLNYAGLAHLVRNECSGSPAGKAAKRLTLRLLGRHFQMERLVRFNAKFSPEWRPRFLVYESRAALPRSAFRVLQAEGYIPCRKRLRSASTGRLGQRARPGIATAESPADGRTAR